MSKSITTGGGERPWQPWERNYSGNRIGVRHDGDWTILHVLSGGAETTASIREHEAWDLAGRVSPKLLATLQEVGAENRRMRDALHDLSAVCAAGNAEDLREAAEEIYCGDDCQNHSYDASCNAHECSLEGTGECRWHRSESLKSLAEALETHAALAAQPAPVREGVEALRSALKPFANLADEIERCAAGSDIPVEGWSMSCTWDDLVRAREALAAPLVPEPVAPPAGEDLAALSAAATLGPWYVESEHSDGSYGAGEDGGEGYEVSTICTEAEKPYGMPGVLFESHNSTVALIEEECTEDRLLAWDVVSKANAKFVVALVNAYRAGKLIPAPTQPAAQGEPVAREAILAVVRAAWALVDNTGHHDLLPLTVNRDDWNDLAARLAALKSLLPDEELPADPPHAVAYFWPARASIDIAGSPAAPAWVKAYEAECQRTGFNFNAQDCIAENFPQIVAPQPAATGRPSVEEVARTLYEHDNRSLRNVWRWDQDGLEAEHPGVREKYLGRARAVLAFLAPDRGDGTRAAGDGWQDISTAPKDGTQIMLWSGIVMRIGWWSDELDSWKVGGESILRSPTHWCPRPPPPAAGDRDGGGR